MSENSHSKKNKKINHMSVDELVATIKKQKDTRHTSSRYYLQLMRMADTLKLVEGKHF